MGSSRRFLKGFQSLTNADMTADQISKVTNVLGMDQIGIQIEWTGSPTSTGTFQVQVSNDYNQDAQGNVLNAGTWCSVALTPAPTVNTGSPIYIQLNNIPAPWIRVKYTHGGSGAGSLNCWISAKGAC